MVGMTVLLDGRRVPPGDSRDQGVCLSHPSTAEVDREIGHPSLALLPQSVSCPLWPRLLRWRTLRSPTIFKTSDVGDYGAGHGRMGEYVELLQAGLRSSRRVLDAAAS